MRWALLLLLLALPVRGETDWSESLPQVQRAPILDLAMAGSTVVAVGERGHILTSTDGGYHWHQQEVPTRNTLTCVSFADHQLGWAAGHAGTLLKTTDGGTSWTQVPLDSLDGESFLTLFFANPEVGFAAGAYGLFLRTADGGASWQRSDPLGEELHFHQIAASPGGRIHAVLETGVLLSSDDLGLTWEEHDSPYGGSLFGVLPLGDGKVVVHGLRGHLFRGDLETGDWQRLALPTESLLMDSVLLPDQRLLVAGMGTEFYIGMPGADTLQAWSQEKVEGASALLALPDGAVLAGGLNGVYRIEPPLP